MTRRQTFALAALVLAATLGATLAGQVTPTSRAWAQFRSTPSLSGVATAPVPDNLRVLWTHETGSLVESSAAIVDGVAYIGVGNGDLLAIDAASGKVRWKYATGANDLGIGPMGFGGKTTLLGVKICAANRLPASYFVSISYMCWAYRRQGVTLDAEGKIGKWLY